VVVPVCARDADFLQSNGLHNSELKILLCSIRGRPEVRRRQKGSVDLTMANPICSPREEETLLHHYVELYLTASLGIISPQLQKMSAEINNGLFNLLFEPDSN
jgi:hypothetical protein